MVRKSNPNALKIIFIFAQIVVFLVVIGGLLWVTAMSHKEDVLDIFSSKLDNAAETMAAQLKANQVPSSLGPEGNGVFIISQNDGSVVVEKHLGTDAQEEEWQRYRTKLIYEMQKQKRGWIVYPEKKNWRLNQPQRVIRYMAIDELGWILAVEAQRPTELQLLKGAFKKSNYVFMLCLILFGAAAIWLINERYFYLIWRSITDTVENNFMSLSGEDSIWDKFKTGSRSGDDLEKEALGLGNLQRKNALEKPRETVAPEVPFIETLRMPTSTEEFKPIDPSAVESKTVQHSEPVREVEVRQAKETPAPQEDGEKKDNPLTINVNEIKSQALKKIIKQFREK